MAAQISNPGKPIIEKEIRFAVVMYGGVSLAIYINGVAQELYKMVRGTARKRNEDDSLGDYFIEKPESTESVYRMLGEQLRARFVVDILSGTSAGGINAIFLGKALANNQPMDQLENLWIDQGNIELLINDKSSLTGMAGMQIQPPPTSLLNSHRMYYQLLKAFDGMDDSVLRSQGDDSPFVDELDLYVTATDIRGLWLPIPLADEDVHEYRYRTVFRFNYSRGEGQDFLRDNNPFLAFAARATSSFPFAFEPIKLEDVDTVLKTGGSAWNYTYDKLKKGWEHFYKDYNREGQEGGGALEADSFDRHSFGDGGYLDNKPFSYITETLLRRRADVPVDRRLFYIEPAPEHANGGLAADRPDAFQNVAAALVSLPRYETIRDDLLQLKTRNNLIERTNNILRQIERIQRTRVGVGKLKVWGERGTDWSDKYLDQILSDYGVGYAAYHQLRVADTLDEFAVALARNIGMEEEGRTYTMLRQIFEEWRRTKYSSDSKDKGDHCSENDLLFRLDLSWRIRRLHFVTQLIDDLMLGWRHACAADPDLTLEEQEQKKYAQQVVKESGNKLWDIPNEVIKNQYFEALLWVKRQINEAYMELRTRGRRLRERNLATRDPKSIDDEDLKAHVQALQPFLQVKNELAAILRDKKRLASICEKVEAFSLSLASRPQPKETAAGYLYRIMKDASRKCVAAMSSQNGTSLPDIPDAVFKNVQDCLLFYYDHFEYFDMLTFPITYATPIGESDVVDVYRISPEDANGLFRTHKSEHPKLAGTKLGNFGAFFRREWRQNDIMWGRLDGAERIISTLLPDCPERMKLLLKAWLVILKENRDSINYEKLQGYLGSSLDDFENAEEPSVEQMAKLQQGLRTYFEGRYALDLEFSPKTTMAAIGRSVSVLGSLLDGLIQKYPAAQIPAFWLTRLGKILMGIMQVAIPNSLPQLLFRYWLNIAYVFEVFLTVLGWLLLGFNNVVTRFGIFAFLCTLSIHLAVYLVGSYITGSALPARILRGLAQMVVIVIFLALFALVYLGLVYLKIATLPALKFLGT